MNAVLGSILKKLIISQCVWFIVLYAPCAFGDMPSSAAQLVGHIENPLIEECSGLEASPTQPDLFWAINDGGNGPYLYAMGSNGRHRGRYLIKAAANRDWEGLDVFRWKNKNHILIADFGDNRQVRSTHRLYIVPEPRVTSEKIAFEGSLSAARLIEYRYPNSHHDAEAVAVDLSQEKILIVTKRDNPPLVFEIPLFGTAASKTHTARLAGRVSHLPPPTLDDLNHLYGEFRSQPTAMDISTDGTQLVLLTYKHAYLFERHPQERWSALLAKPPRQIRLPLPERTANLRQRESICFSHINDGAALMVTSEGTGAGLYIIPLESITK